MGVNPKMVGKPQQTHGFFLPKNGHEMGCFGGTTIWVFPKIVGFPPKSSHLKHRGFPLIINHPFWGTPVFGNTHIGYIYPSYTMDIIINHDKDPYKTTSIGGFSLWLNWGLQSENSIHFPEDLQIAPENSGHPTQKNHVRSMDFQEVYPFKTTIGRSASKNLLSYAFVVSELEETSWT